MMRKATFFVEIKYGQKVSQMLDSIIVDLFLFLYLLNKNIFLIFSIVLAY